VVSDTTFAVAFEAGRLIRPPATFADDPTTGAPVLTFEPPLTAAEQAILDRLIRVRLSHVPGISTAEWQALEPDIAGLKTYLGLPTPTAGQTASATKAIIRVLAALLRD
jgi:hypothetical protein